MVLVPVVLLEPERAVLQDVEAGDGQVLHPHQRPDDLLQAEHQAELLDGHPQALNLGGRNLTTAKDMEKTYRKKKSAKKKIGVCKNLVFLEVLVPHEVAVAPPELELPGGDELVAAHLAQVAPGERHKVGGKLESLAKRTKRQIQYSTCT